VEGAAYDIFQRGEDNLIFYSEFGQYYGKTMTMAGGWKIWKLVFEF